MKLGIFGGTFNPIHYGHLAAAEEVKAKLGLNKIIFVPSGNPPLKDRELADAKHRYRMVRLAIFKNHSLAVSDIEYKKKDKSYSVDTIEKLRRIYPGARLYFITGIDAFIDIPNWWQPDKLVSLADFIVISRPSFKFTGLASSPYLRINKNILKKLDSAKLQTYKTKLKSGRDIIIMHITPFEISATGVRKLIKRGKSIKYLLPEEVESYIITHKIYRVKS
ncbi:MAG: nicotinate (nicotinamide) nucleotide adenylyltransferase [Nitrospirae bacterium RBG_16_43_8]|nr:MAG: nicotinate (nicotinamide) nucleotide adenylyltransferase [Nitrospirae bacterium RBG_16_43_8]